MFHRGFRGSRRRSGPRPVIQSYKKVLYYAGASFTAGFQTEFIAQGVDSVAAGQTGPTDVQVPTGSIIKYVEVQFAANNPSAAAVYLNCTLQYTRSNQNMLDPGVVGGHAQRNQVLHMDLFSVGHDQNSTHKFKFKIPKHLQRLQEGMDWGLTWANDATVGRTVQIIYKFYR